MDTGVIAIVAFIGMATIIGIPAAIVIRGAIRTERARSRERWAAGTGRSVDDYNGGCGNCSGSIDCSGGIGSGGFGGGG
jgi:hypothetical protein